jgi:hypothetical protein
MDNITNFSFILLSTNPQINSFALIRPAFFGGDIFQGCLEGVLLASFIYVNLLFLPCES